MSKLKVELPKAKQIKAVKTYEDFWVINLTTGHVVQSEYNLLSAQRSCNILQAHDDKNNHKSDYQPRHRNGCEIVGFYE